MQQATPVKLNTQLHDPEGKNPSLGLPLLALRFAAAVRNIFFPASRVILLKICGVRNDSKVHKHRHFL